MADETEPTIMLRHGTTRARAERIVAIGPDPSFRQVGDPQGVTAEEFAMTGPGPSAVGSCETYAKKKALLFPDEGGPVILEVEMTPDALDFGEWVGYWQFEGDGLQDLIRAWPTLAKRIVPL